MVGLGNPGPLYQYQRHTIGFRIVDALAAKLKMPITTVKFQSLMGKAEVRGQQVVMMKPQTFMNLSGEAVAEAVTAYRVEMKDVLVVHDELDLPLGVIRFATDRGAGGHRGVQSVIDTLECKTFCRLRFGIGRPTTDAADYVLTDFLAEEQLGVQHQVEQSVLALEEWVLHGLSFVQQKYH